MKHILLLRHAKSSWESPGLKDFDRPLNARGIKDAGKMGIFLKKAGYEPQKIVSSPAERAKQTVQLFMDASGLKEEILDWNEDLYYGSVADYLASLQGIADWVDCLLLVGHNPLIEDTLSRLSSDGSRPVSIMPTAALACLEHPLDSWKQVKPGTCRLKWMVIPRLLKNL